jgi:hypothetical protein
MPTLALACNSLFPTPFVDKIQTDTRLSVKARLLAHVLARHANAEGLASIPAPELRQLCGFGHLETLIEARRELEHRGYVSTDRRSQKIVAYRLSIEREGA